MCLVEREDLPNHARLGVVDRELALDDLVADRHGSTGPLPLRRAATTLSRVRSASIDRSKVVRVLSSQIG